MADGKVTTPEAPVSPPAAVEKKASRSPSPPKKASRSPSPLVAAESQLLTAEVRTTTTHKPAKLRNIDAP